MLSPMIHRKLYFTKVEVEQVIPAWNNTWLGQATAAGHGGFGGIENDTDDDGGDCIELLKPETFPNDKLPQTIRTDNFRIPWNARYNYRLGFGAIYQMNGINLYKEEEGSPSEIQVYVREPNGAKKHFGINVDPDDRNFSESGVEGASFVYPKDEIVT